MQELTKRYNIFAVFDENKSGALDTKFQWCVECRKKECYGKNCPMKNNYIRKLFGKSENRKGKVVLEFMIIKEDHLRTKTNSQVQESECNDNDISLSKKMNACVSKQKISIKNPVKDLDLNNNEAKSDSESLSYNNNDTSQPKETTNVVTVKKQIIITEGLTKDSILNDKTNMLHADKINHGRYCDATDKSTSWNECPTKLEVHKEKGKKCDDVDSNDEMRLKISDTIKKDILLSENVFYKPSSNTEFHLIILDLDACSIQIEKQTISYDYAWEEMVEKKIAKVELDSKIKKGQNKQTEIILVEKLDILIISEKLLTILQFKSIKTRSIKSELILE
ncbi:15700_t:CDS:2 [Acaulospora morrowiae]|uniref:15700_t:CDS:1 n=1 Tax=Acaulospora morrowiae TaxID=94023 RepID=A0A9N9FC66_9GLOM|nr:15700_t:CDS:2 [Acaulospora morrowiae]